MSLDEKWLNTNCPGLYLGVHSNLIHSNLMHVFFNPCQCKKKVCELGAVHAGALLCDVLVCGGKKIQQALMFFNAMCLNTEHKFGSSCPLDPLHAPGGEGRYAHVKYNALHLFVPNEHFAVWMDPYGCL